MKKLVLSTLLLLCSICGFSYDFEVDGIYYNILSTVTCEVTYKEPQIASYFGNIVIPEKVTYNGNTYYVTRIGRWAFINCTSLENVTIPKSNALTTIGEDAFIGCTSLTSIEIPNSITSIEEGAFEGCTSLESIEIPNSVTSIEGDTFGYCTSLASITIPNSVTCIKSYAFAECSNLTSVTIGNSVTDIWYKAFEGCNALTTIYSLNTTPPSVESEGNFTIRQYMTLNIFVPQESLKDYMSANVWKEFLNLQGFDPTGVESVRGDAINGSNVYYDIRGNRLEAPQKGLNIINGKKVVVK